jgi:hypothetical protein
MAITIEPADRILSPVGDIVGTDFSYTITATSDLGTITSIEIETDLPDDNVTIADGTISGAYSAGIFNQTEVHYVDKGESDKTQTPVVVLGSLDDVPSFKEVFTVKPDPRESIDVTYTVTVTADEEGSVVTEVDTFTHTILQDYTPIKDWVTDYFANRY